MRRVVRILGLAIALLSLIFVAGELVRSRAEVQSALAGADVRLLVLALPVGAAGFLLVGLGWRRCLSLLGARVAVREVLPWYYLGQLGKYMPGGIWPVVGRGEMARQGGVPGGIGYGSTLMSMGLTYLAAILTAALALVLGGGGTDGVLWRPLIALLPVGILVLHPSVLDALLRLTRRLSGRELEIPVPDWFASLRLLVWHLPVWIAIGGATWLVAAAVDSSPPSFLNILFATTLSWVTGFLVVAAPGGVGVREAVFVAAGPGISSPAVAATVAVLARVLFIVLDVSAAGLAVAHRRHLADRRG